MNFNSGTSNGQANSGVLVHATPPNAGINLNLQQPFYKTIPNILPTGNGVPHWPVPDVMFPRTPGSNTYQLGTDRSNDREGGGGWLIGSETKSLGPFDSLVSTLGGAHTLIKSHTQSFSTPYLTPRASGCLIS
jgi:hypothetical protein